MFQPINLAMDRQNRVFVTDYGENNVKIFNFTDLDTPINELNAGFNFNEKSYTFPDVIVLSGATTTVTEDELLVVESGNTETEFSFDLGNFNLIVTDFVLTDGVETFTGAEAVDGVSVLTGDAGGEGTLNLITGEVTVTFNTAPDNATILVTYKYSDNDLLFVSDTFNHVVKVFSLHDMSFISEFGSFGSGDGQFIEPCGMALSSDSTLLYVIDRGNGRVTVWTIADQTYSTSYGEESDLYQPHDILNIGADVLYVTDTGNNRIVSFEANGSKSDPYVIHKFDDYVDSDTITYPAVSIATDGTLYYVTDIYRSLIGTYSPDMVNGGFDIETSVGGYDHTTYDIRFPKGLIINGNTLIVTSPGKSDAYDALVGNEMVEIDIS